MAMTSKPSDKFAYLHSGMTDTKSLYNIKEVYLLLTKFYNYPAANVKITIGGTDTSSILTDCPNESIADVASFKAKFYEFCTQVNNNNTVTDGVSNPVNSVLLYFTGSIDNTDPGNILYQIADGTTPVNISGSQFKMALRGFNPTPDPMDPSTIRKNYILNSYINFIFDLNSALDLDTVINGFDGDHIGSKTYSCSTGETSAEDLSGASVFTYHWCRAFKMVPQIIGTTTYYGDKMITSAPSEPVNNELVSFKKACEYAKLQWPAPSSVNPICDYIGSGEFYPGLPLLVIRDGNPHFWQSPDIRLFHPNPTPPPDELPDPSGTYIDDYEVDDPAYATIAGYIFKNHLHINIWNFGTHPVVHLKTNYILYDTGCSGTGTSLSTAYDDIIRDADKYLIPVADTAPVITSTADTEDPLITYITGIEYNFSNIPFLSALHRCIRAKTALGTDPEPDMTSWIYIADTNAEAQRNINNGAISDGAGGKKAEKEIVGFSRKRFLIENPFKKKKLFRIIDLWNPDTKDLIDVSIYRIGERKRKINTVLHGKVHYHDVTLEPGEKAEFNVEVRNKVNIKILKVINLHFEILVAEKASGKIFPGRMAPGMSGFVKLAGFTIALKVNRANLNIQVADEKGKVAALTTVHIESQDGLQRAELVTDRNGMLKLEGINQAQYRITVIGKTGKSSVPVLSDLVKTPDRVLRMSVKRKHL